MSRPDSALLVCPTLNPGSMFKYRPKAYSDQKKKPAASVIVDSSSNDGPVEIKKYAGFKVNVISRDHLVMAKHAKKRLKIMNSSIT